MVDTLIGMIGGGRFDQDLAINVFRYRDKEDPESNKNWEIIKQKLKAEGYVWGYISRNKMGYKKLSNGRK